ncbi:MAG: RidA family protein [Candidatus Bipolaricaulis sp.]|nr:RidA family protein [Candidatus Bipolaricaulis sp.]MDD5647092.1 RidA family protein [Candidatus Bipolaricaulis sp.]
MKREAIRTEKAPGAVGPYSQGMGAGQFVFTSGQIPLTPGGEMVRGDIQSAARQALSNVESILVAGGASMNDVVKVTVFLTNMADFAAVNQVYAERFKEPFPARSAIQVVRLPLDAPLEIEAIAVIP